jgi:predicted nucleic acid-binding protein
MRGDFPVLFDTNVYIGILLASDSNKKYLRQVLISTFPEFRCAVVFHELIRGAAYGREARISSYQHSDLKFNNFLVESPNWQDWRNAAYSISEVFRREAHRKTVNNLRKATNDALIATMALRTESTLITQDNDYDYLKTSQRLKHLKVMDVQNLLGKIGVDYAKYK